MVRVAIIGHIAFNRDVTPQGQKVSLGGAAYYSAMGASATNPRGVGVVAAVGNDFAMERLNVLQVNTEGVQVVKDKETARFTVIQRGDGSRSFSATWGAAEQSHLELFPKNYGEIKYAHLCTAPPLQQLEWIKKLRSISNKIIISVDTFEQFTRDFYDESIKVIRACDFLFINQEEASVLQFEASALSRKPHILKMGANGAKYSDGSKKFYVPAPQVCAIDTTGAGDVLAGAFLALVSNGMSAESALLKATRMASFSVQKFGVEHLLTPIECNF